MSDARDEAGEAVTLARLADELRELKSRAEREASGLRADNARLSERLARMERSVRRDAADGAGEEPPAAGIDPDRHPMSRRGALLALGGAGLAVGSALMGAEPAAAANPPLVLNTGNTATSTTTLSIAAGQLTGPLLRITNAGVAPSVYGVSAGGSGIVNPSTRGWAVVGDSGNGYGVLGASTTIGLYGIAATGSGLLTGSEVAGAIGDCGHSGGWGLYGVSLLSDGVRGLSAGGSGVYGTIQSGPSGLLGSQVGGVVGDAAVDDGVLGLSASRNGVAGLSSGGNGVFGQTTGNALSGVFGLDASTAGGNGVLGKSTGGSGVVGIAQSASGLLPGLRAGVRGDTDGNGLTTVGVLGASSGGIGVAGTTSVDGLPAVVGSDVSTNGGVGVTGQSGSGTGVSGTTASPTAVGLEGQNSAGGPSLQLGLSSNATLPATATPGQFIVLSDGSLHYCKVNNEWVSLGPSALGMLVGDNPSGPTLQLDPFGSTTLPATATPGQFIVLSDGSLHYAYADDKWVTLGPAVVGLGNGPTAGVEASNPTGAQLRLDPGPATVPATATPGQLVVLADGSLNYAYAPDAWVPLTNGVFPITPVRVIDTVTGVGGITGPLVPGSTIHTSSVLTGGGTGIPEGAAGIVGNFAISGLSLATPLNGLGVATIFPAGEQAPATANINAGNSFAISNSVTIGFGTGANAGQLSILWTGGGNVPPAQAYLDVTGYIL